MSDDVIPPGTNLAICLDFECPGGAAKYAFTQLGAIIFDMLTGKVYREFNMYSSMKDREWEKRCVEEFWEKNPERYAETLKMTAEAPLGPYEVAAKFVEWAREHTKGFDCMVLGDNLTYDMGIMKVFSPVDTMYLLGHLTDYIELPSLYYGMAVMNKRMRILSSVDMSSKKLALEAVRALNRDNGMEYPIPATLHDHHPVNDCKHMKDKFMFIMDSVSKAAGNKHVEGG